MDAFSGFQTVAAGELPYAVPVMDPFHVVRLAVDDALDRSRQRVQQDALSHRGDAGDPLYGVRRIPHTGDSFLTDKQAIRLAAVFAPTSTSRSKRPGATTSASSVAAYRESDKHKAKQTMRSVIDAVTSGVPTALT